MLLVAICSVLVVLAGRLAEFEQADTLLGAGDYIHYYAAARVYLRHDNPYDLELLRAISREVNRADTDPVVQWIYPPWVLPLFLFALAPAARLSFPDALFIWQALSFLALLGTGFVVWRIVFERFESRHLLPMLMATLFFVPAYDTFRLGQVSIFITFGIATFCYFWSRKSDAVAGMWLIFPACKVTAWYLLAPALAAAIVKERRWSTVLGFLLLLCFLLALGEAHHPGLARHWIEALAYSRAHILKFRNPTLPDLIQSAILSYTGVLAEWPLTVIPIATAVAVFIFGCRKKSRLAFPDFFPILILSVFTAPYSWFFDQAALVIVQVGLVAIAYAENVAKSTRRWLFISLALLQCLAFAFTFLPAHDQFYCWWFPVAIFGVLTLFASRTRQPDEEYEHRNTP